MLVLLLGNPLSAFADTGRQQVLVALPAVYALTSTLSDGTTLKVVRLPADSAVPMESQANALSRLEPAVFQQATAVVTLGNLWRADPLYTTARRHNLRIVEIDASHSWDTVKPGVAVARVPSNDVPWATERDVDGGLSPYAWLGPVNAMRMSAIIATDLARLSPPDAPRIERNLAALEGRLRQLKANYGARLLAVPDLRVLSLADEFTYLFGEFGIFVDGWFVRQDIDWSDADCTALTRYLRERDIHVVVHKWAPDARIAKAIEDGGARLLILDAGNPGMLADAANGYEALLSSNLDSLLTAFAPPGPNTSGDHKSPLQ
ncbi:metal ion ABC transporter substrate-binding protein [Pseudomonas sp. ATCC 43928]|jgi:ABC-type Zn uptake system ZnuABC Zn-binding protein ZnuA|uniref:metal ABC transporter solute-binding protein, Zn/Mn family n=1 Tax=Pseudomonas TaxID=286 RepID=UPI00110ED542|nr:MULTISPECIES: zinc ABC transporter substrate-binding protein [unclassified Pseudomonas]MBD9615781.1 zinc ABC transporter substrate-binding protein [Pseudomonas sp. PDM07]QDV95253.1 metal ion ABC transporter substrate-binding protein [Pseudomonas sp. ATCC 43928]